MNIAHDPDFGTPASEETATVSIEIDGITTTARKGDTILRAAREFGVDIPKLCATDNLKAIDTYMKNLLRRYISGIAIPLFRASYVIKSAGRPKTIRIATKD